MKISINETLEVSDEQRVQIADILDAERTKRQATRDEMKAFIWALGSDWEALLATEWDAQFALRAVPDLDEDADVPLDGMDLI